MIILHLRLYEKNGNRWAGKPFFVAWTKCNFHSLHRINRLFGFDYDFEVLKASTKILRQDASQNLSGIMLHFWDTKLKNNFTICINSVWDW